MNTDIAILGSGASGAHSLMCILDELKGTADAVDVVVIDRDHQFHSGIPYGHRSGPTSLLITALSDFLPSQELSDFIRWLDEKKEQIVTSTKIDAEWIANHKEDIENGRWADLYLPRRVYGRYLRHQVESAILDAENSGSARVRFVNADITEVIPEDGGTHTLRGRSTCTDASAFPTVEPLGADNYEAISVHGEETIEVRAHTVVLAIGSPPVRRLQINVPERGIDLATISSESSGPHTADQFSGYVADVHSPSLDTVIACVSDRLRQMPQDQRRVLVVGGNADALEFILAAAQLTADTAAQLCVLSPRGRPPHWRHERVGELPEIPALRAYLDSIDAGADATAVGLLRAVKSDVAQSVRMGNDKSTVSAVINVVGRVVSRMDATELASMATDCGLQISNQIRRAGGDAIDLVEALVDEGTVSFEPGKFEAASADQGLFTVKIRRTGDSEFAAVTTDDSADAQSQTLPLTYSVIVNATGFEPVPGTRSQLLRQLQESGVATASCSSAGLAADSRYRVAQGIYVIGPLLSGFHHDGTAVWHAESVSRIIGLAKKIAPLLVADVRPRLRCPFSPA